jgi:hypothetical protein
MICYCFNLSGLPKTKRIPCHLTLHLKGRVKLRYATWNVNFSVLRRWCCWNTSDTVAGKTCPFHFFGCKQTRLWGLDHHHGNTILSVLHTLMAEDGKKQRLKTLLSQLVRREWLTIKRKLPALVWRSPPADGSSGTKCGDECQAWLYSAIHTVRTPGFLGYLTTNFQLQCQNGFEIWGSHGGEW